MNPKLQPTEFPPIGISMTQQTRKLVEPGQPDCPYPAVNRECSGQTLMTTNRSLKTGMATMALVAAVAFGGAALSPILVRAQSDKTFTHSFRQVSAEQVLAWMQKQGIEVKFQKADLPAKLMTFAFDGMGRDELMKSFGDMVGMRAVKRGDVYTLLRSVGSDAQGEPFGSEGIEDCPMGLEGEDFEIYEMEGDQDPMVFGFDDFDFDFDGEDFMFEPMQDPGAMVEEIMKALEESGALSGKKLTQSEKDALKERLTERLGKLHGGMMFMGPDHFKYALPGKEGQRFFMLDPEHMKMFEGQHKMRMEELHKHLQELEKSGHLNKEEMARAQEEVKRAMLELEKSGKMQRFTPEMLEKMKAEGHFKMADPEHVQKLMEELHKEGKFKVWTPEMIEKMKAEGHVKMLDQDHMRKMMEELHKEGKMQRFTPEMIEKMKAEGQFFKSDEFKKHMEEMQKHLGENMKVMQLKLENLKKFAASLTPEQRKLHDKQGYLTPDDLTKEQRALLGIDGKDDVNFTYNNDKEKITIKSKGTAKTTSGSGNKGVITL